MKKNKLIVIAAICLVAGLVIFGIGFWMADFDFKNLSNEPDYTEKTFDSSKMYNAIVVKDEDTDVDIVKSEDDSFHISYFENEKRQYELKENNDTLTLTIKKNDKWHDLFFNFNFNVKIKKTTIEVPEAFYGKIFVQTCNSYIALSDVKTTDIEIITSNDDVTTNKVTCDGTLTAISSNGDINIEKTQIGSDAEFKTSNNDVNMTDATCGNLTIDTSNGDVELSNVLSKSYLNITTSNDDVTFNAVEFGKGMDCKNSNGNVKGTIVGEPKDFSITSKTSNGENNLPDQFIAGEKILKIITSNDDIDIQFTKSINR